MYHILKLLYSKYWVVRNNTGIARDIIHQLFDDLVNINLYPKFILHKSKSSYF